MPTDTQRIIADGKLKIGDYVLGTRWGDGDPHDPFGVGFLAEDKPAPSGKYQVVDAKGNPIGRFTRIAKISPECGNWIVLHLKDIEQGSRSLWSIRRFWKTLAKENNYQ